mmetsp:Transcript_15169/g.24821  ORF Transcript_15169/g.24821 Transcript_15169/m.24821 type:complete len:102 (+) Transcript_15169:46-351(+)
MAEPADTETGGEKGEAEQESTAKLILYAILDCLAVIGRSIFAVLSFFWSMVRSCCYPVKEGFARCVDRYKEWKTPYTRKKSASNVPQFTYGPSYGSSGSWP